MYAIEVEARFSAAHALRLPGGTLEPLHGHDFLVTVRVEADTLDSMETVLDFHALQQWLAEVLAPWQNRTLNDLEPFRTTINPSAERIAQQIGTHLLPRLEQVSQNSPRRALRLAHVRITEAPGCLAIWSPDPAS